MEGQCLCHKFRGLLLKAGLAPVSAIAPVQTSLRLSDIGRALIKRERDSVGILERQFAERYQFPHAIFFSSARLAVDILARALHLEGREVACPAYMCAAVPIAAARSGGRVRFVDSAEDHFLPDLDAWERIANPRVGLAILAPLFGYPVDDRCIDLLRAIAPASFILMDEAQSYSASIDERVDGALFSLGLGKAITSLSGGMLLLRDDDVAMEVRALAASRCIAPQPRGALSLLAAGAGAIALYRSPLFTWQSALDRFREDPRDEGSGSSTAPFSFQARIGAAQFSTIASVLRSRREIGEYYDRRLRDEGFQSFAYATTPTWVRFPFAVRRREPLVPYLKSLGIHVGSFLDYECSTLRAFAQSGDVSPNAALWARSMINLPNWNGLSIASADRVISGLLSSREAVGDAAGWPLTGPSAKIL